MRLLLDTHIALWQVFDLKLLPAAAHSLLSQPGVEAHVSVVSLWEIGIKHGLLKDGRPKLPVSATEARIEFERAGLTILPMLPRHADALDGLPPHHGDPFDRLLVAQALTEPMRLVTADRQLAAYGPLIDLV